MTTTAKRPPWADTLINPRTGRPWTLADAEVSRELDAELEAMKKQPELARQFLQELGLITKTGRLTRRYGG